jgi:hypothetical protein
MGQAMTLGAAFAILAFAFGCASAPPPNQAAETTKYTLDNTDKFAPLDDASRRTVACTGAQYFTLADGRLEVIANLKNRSGHKIEVQASCAFRDEQDLPVGETPWEPVMLTENMTQAVHFTAPSVAGKKYTVRVRQGR